MTIVVTSVLIFPTEALAPIEHSARLLLCQGLEGQSTEEEDHGL